MEKNVTDLHLLCPRCSKVVSSQDWECPHCGVNLALAVSISESALDASLPPSDTPIAPEILVPRLGEILLEKGVLTPQALQGALEAHRLRIRAGSSVLFGQVLLETGLVNREILDQVVTEQILQLQSALQRSNRQLEQRVEERTRDLQKALNKLSRLNELKSSFVASISHELRTPLTHIKGYLTLFADGSLGQLTQDQSDALNVLLRSEARLEKLIDDLIQFSLTAKGELFLNLSEVAVNDIIRIVAERGTELARARNIELVIQMPVDMATLKVDVEKIQWVLIQFLDNAVKFTHPGGTVTLKAIIEDGLVTFKVKDTGIGIPPDQIDEIFEPFHQLDGSDTRHAGGTGLGLTLARRIVEAHGSSVKVYSEVGKGSILSFSLLINESNSNLDWPIS